MNEVGNPRVITLKVMALLGIAGALLLMAAGQARAGWTNTFEIAPEINGANVKVAVDEAGNANVLWATQADFTDPYEMLFARVPAGGIPETGPVTTLTPPEVGGSHDSAIATNAAGHAVAAYSVGPLGGTRAAAVVIPPEGDPGPVEDLTSLAGTNVSSPKVAVAPSGQALVVFQYGSPESDQSIAGALIAPDGTPSELLDISQLEDDDQGYVPDVGVDDSGEFRVVWSQTHSVSGDPESIRSATVSPDGEVGEPVDVSPSTPAARTPRISVEADGDAAIIWMGDPGSAVTMARVSADGAAGEPIPVSPPGLYGDPRINVSDSGDVTVMFMGFGGDGIGPSVVRIPAGGAPGTPVFVPPAGLSSFFGEFEGNSKGDGLVVFSVDTPDGTVVRARRIPATGAIPESEALSSPGAGQPIAGAVGDGGDMFAAFGDGLMGTELSGTRFAGVLATGTAPAFGTVEVGDSVNRQVVLRNEGGSPLDLGAIGVSGAAASDYSVEAGSCPQLRLQQDSSCVISVQFKPSAAGTRTAELNVESDGVRTSSPVPLTGTGVAAPTPPNPPKATVTIARVMPARTAVKRGKSKAIRVMVKNTGGAAANGVRVCSRLGGGAKKKVKVRRCATLGQIDGGASKTASLKVTAKRGRPAKGKARVGLRLTSGNGGGDSAAAVIRIKR